MWRKSVGLLRKEEEAREGRLRSSDMRWPKAEDKRGGERRATLLLFEEGGETSANKERRKKGMNVFFVPRKKKSRVSFLQELQDIPDACRAWFTEQPDKSGGLSRQTEIQRIHTYPAVHTPRRQKDTAK